MENTTAWQSFFTVTSDVLGLPLSPVQQARLQQLYALILQGNTLMNLTRITDLKDFIDRHLLDSLSLWPFLKEGPPAFQLADIGSGAGFPALPLAIVFPEATVYAVESVQKKARFIEQSALDLGLTNLKVIAERSELVGQNPRYREQFDIVTARGVAALNVLCELCLPLVKLGGRFIALKTLSALAEEGPAAKKALITLGGHYQQTYPYMLPQLKTHGLGVMEKQKPTPRQYPRQPGIPAKKPL
jgi:16S rRNA (guanine527-N7)-methyltransferase